MISFLSFMAAPAVTSVTEKGFFGKLFVRLGRLFIVVGDFVFQQGGLLGYTFKEEPDLLEKLIAPEPSFMPGDLIKFLNLSIKDTVENMLAKVADREKTFFQLFTLPELASCGIDESELLTSKQLQSKVSQEFASTVMRHSFLKGVAFGYHFPDMFKQYWEYHYRIRPESEWNEMREIGLELPEYQQERPIQLAISEMAEGALIWSEEVTSGVLNSHDKDFLNALLIK